MEAKSTDKSTLSTGKYTVEFSSGATEIYKINELEDKEWVATTSDPQLAMTIVEGLILVEQKRFYHPESQPTFHMAEEPEQDDKPAPPFIRKGSETG
jgi:hypothetical protein